MLRTLCTYAIIILSYTNIVHAQIESIIGKSSNNFYEMRDYYLKQRELYLIDNVDNTLQGIGRFEHLTKKVIRNFKDGKIFGLLEYYKMDHFQIQIYYLRQLMIKKYKNSTKE